MVRPQVQGVTWLSDTRTHWNELTLGMKPNTAPYLITLFPSPPTCHTISPFPTRGSILHLTQPYLATETL